MAVGWDNTAASQASCTCGAFVDHWDGTSWTAGNVVSPTSGNSVLYGVSCISATDCITVGYQGAQNTQFGPQNYTTFAAHWNGAAWTPQITPNPPNIPNPVLANGSQYELKGVSCTSSTACTAVGDGAAQTLAERWNGLTWSVQAMPNLPDPGQLSGVSCPSTTACTAVGSESSGASGTTFGIAERWDGTNWNAQSVPNPAGASVTQLRSVSCAKPNDCMAAGGSQPAAVGTYDSLLIEHYS
jgi:hypothetical protein